MRANNGDRRQNEIWRGKLHGVSGLKRWERETLMRLFLFFTVKQSP